MGCQLVQWLRTLALNHPTKTLSIVEVGPGEAELSCDLIDHLVEQLPDLIHRLELVLVEANPGMEQRQRKRLEQHQSSRDSHQHLPHRWTSLSNLKTSPVIGVLIAHELLDAFPVERLELNRWTASSSNRSIATRKRVAKKICTGEQNPSLKGFKSAWTQRC